MKSVVSEKGQITIPKAVREQLGLYAGTVLVFSANHGKLVATKKATQDVFSKWRGRGKLPAGRSVDEYIRHIRDVDSH